jgi:endonuclease III
MPRESKANRLLRTERLIAGMKKAYPDVRCALTFGDPWELMVATILSAQCTDKRVNEVTPGLFKQFPTPKRFAAAKLPAIEEAIRSTGFFRNKAKNIHASAKLLLTDFDGVMPRTMIELLTFPGVARKTASCILGNAFGLAEGIVVDTHVIRLAGRLGLSKQTTPEKIERDLMELVPGGPEEWILFSHLIQRHGRTACMARNPHCPGCPLREDCPSADTV